VVRRRLRVEGIVQGVGFRPFAARLAAELGLRVASDDPRVAKEAFVCAYHLLWEGVHVALETGDRTLASRAGAPANAAAELYPFLAIGTPGTDAPLAGYGPSVAAKLAKTAVRRRRSIWVSTATSAASKMVDASPACGRRGSPAPRRRAPTRRGRRARGTRGSRRSRRRPAIRAGRLARQTIQPSKPVSASRSSSEIPSSALAARSDSSAFAIWSPAPADRARS
jgi:hypothetical protein